MYKVLIIFCVLLSFTCYGQDHVVYFDIAKETLAQKEITILDSVLNELDKEREYIVRLVGHTDAIGGLKYNQILSKKRANSIQKYLSKSPITFSFIIDWKAYSVPAHPNDSDKGRAGNRRVEIFFKKVVPKKDKWEVSSQVFKLDHSKSYLLHSDNGCTFTLKAGSFDMDIADTVRIRITAYNDPTDFLAGGLPMSYTRGLKEFTYQSEKMIKVEAFDGKRPVELLHKIGFECPDMEVNEGLRLYKFNGTNEPFVDIVIKEYPGKIEEIKINNNPRNDNPVKKELKLETDKLAEKKVKPDTGQTSIATVNHSFLPIPTILACDSISKFNHIIKLGHQLFEEESQIDFRQDFNPYSIRYGSFEYDGMMLTCQKDLSKINSIKTTTKKRFLRKQLLLKFDNTPEHPEYTPLKNTVWIISYKEDAKIASKIKNLSPNDFIISKSKKNYFIEFKGESDIYKFSARPKKKRKSAVLFKEYRKRYLTRIKTFNDSIGKRLEKAKVIAHFDFYNLLHELNDCINLDLNLKNKIPDQITSQKDCLPPLTKEDKYFIDWVVYNTKNRKKVQKVIREIETKPEESFGCLCDTLIISPPVLGKWSDANAGVSDNKIIFIGLGIYNLDYVFELEKKQVISKPLFITSEGDTVLKCWSNTIDRVKQSTACKQQIFTVIPEFNGLLQHNLGNQISLLKEKENILFLTTPYKRYICHIDMSNQKKFSGNTFIVEEITQQTKTLDGLRKELEKTEKK